MKKLLLLLLVMIIAFPSMVTASEQPETYWRISISVESDSAPDKVWKAEFLNAGREYAWPQLAAEPIVINGRTLVPLRQIAESMGYSVQWMAQDQSIKLTGKSIQGEAVDIEMIIDQNTAYVNNKQVTLDAAPRIEKGTTMIPLRFISEAMGCWVKYDQGTYNGVNNNTIYITGYQLLEKNEMPDIWQNDSNYQSDRDGYPHLRQEGQTARGIKLGDSIKTVLKAYPRGMRYPDTFTGELWYSNWIAFEAGDYGMVFKFKNGTLTEVYGSH